MLSRPRPLLRKAIACSLAVSVALSPLGTSAVASTSLADAPILATKKVPPNLMLALSVEWPTGVVAAYNDNFDTTPGFECTGRDGSPSTATGGFGVCYFENRTYLGYFDPKKCYDYVGTTGKQNRPPPSPSATEGYFTPVAFGTGAHGHQCSSKWSGNFLNWATMQAIDTFRWALTGGDRVVDTSSRTIIEKARHTGQGRFDQFPVKRIRNSSFTQNGITVPGVSPSTVTPRTESRVFVRVHDGTIPSNTLGPFWYDFYGNTKFIAPQMQVLGTSSDVPDWTSAAVETYYLRVEVCKPGMLEPNCHRYGNSWKPTGLIQQNADRMRFGVFSYLLESDRSRAGGVMRARMKDVGPMKIDPVNPPTPNPRAEFSASDGTFVANPDVADAAASAVQQSGVINYLNKFGKASPGYKFGDTLSEMYYESLRYLRNMGSATPEYVAGMTDQMKDGFPVITVWDDPIQYSCQKNYSLLIADVSTWCDFALPGTSITSHGGCTDPSSNKVHPWKISNPIPGLNVSTEVNKVGALDNSANWSSPGYGNLATTTAPSSSHRGNTWYLAGLAYWANTNNLRPDKTAGTGDRVTVRSYMVDVAETGSWSVTDANGKAINQLWLAAKYGGFDDVNLDGKPANPKTWDKNEDGVPDNYFRANRPDLMVRSLNDVFDSVLSHTESAAGATVISSKVQSGESVYQVQYTSDGWVGDVFGSTLTFDALGNARLSRSWSARPLLDSLVRGDGWNTKRKIATWDGSEGVPFRWNKLTKAQQDALRADGMVGEEVLKFLRGDRSKEGNPYRIRDGILGDIVSAEAVPVGAPQAPYSDITNPGYSAFKKKHASREKVVYVAANDGMLHAFAGGTPGGGAELFAYVPSFGFSGPSVPPTPSDNGLAALARAGYKHRFYVDATPVVADVDFERTGRNPALVKDDDVKWRTILVGGLGKGGKGYYALDITDPKDMAESESELASKVLWEFTDPDMGFTYGRPVIVKLRQYGWVVMVTSGYNNLDGPNPGQGFLYILNAKTGKLLQKIGTGVGDANNPSGFTHIASYGISFQDFVADQVYGGDLLGNVFRFDVSAASGSFPAPVKVAELRDPDNKPQPVTTAPRVEQSLDGVTRWLFVGTGKLLDGVDMGNTQIQTMYALKDGTKTTPTTSGLPIVRSNLVRLTADKLLTGVTVPADKRGWLHDLSGIGAAGATERISFDPVANAGVIAWVGNIPSTNPCSPGISSRIYAVNYETGKSTLVEAIGSSVLVPFSTYTSGLVKLQFIQVGDRVGVFGSSRLAELPLIPSEPPASAGTPRRVNWRQIIN